MNNKLFNRLFVLFFLIVVATPIHAAWPQLNSHDLDLKKKRLFELNLVMQAGSKINRNTAVRPSAVAAADQPVHHYQSQASLNVSDSSPNNVGTNSFHLPWLQTRGTKIVDDQGQEVKLRGFNIEGGLMWQGPDWGLGLLSESQIAEGLSKLTSQKDVEAFRDTVNENFITEEDIARIKNIGANVIRIPFHYRILEDDHAPYTYKEKGWRLLDHLVNLCEKYGIYAILDPHSLPGGQSKNFVADPVGSNLFSGRAELWTKPENQKRAIELWRAIARHYSDRSVVAGYDLMAAPDHPDREVEPVIRLYREIIEAIRGEDSRHIVILHGTEATTNFDIFPGKLDANQVYEPHLYTWFNGGTRSQIAAAKKHLDKWRAISAAHQTPLWVGEWGENFYERIIGTLAHLEAAESGVSGWGYWTWKRTATKFPAILEIPMPESWKKVASWIVGPRWSKVRPTREETLQGMRDFLESMKFENCREDTRLIEILFNNNINR